MGTPTLPQKYATNNVTRVHVIIVTYKDGQAYIPLSQEKRGDFITKHFAWISGHVDPGEQGQPLKTAMRELKEETGIQPLQANFADTMYVAFEKPTPGASKASSTIIPTMVYIDREGKYNQPMETSEKTNWTQ